MIEPNAGDNIQNFRIEILSDYWRDADTILPLIQRHVEPGTTVRTNCCREYNGL